ncbi:hypothetical protein ACFSTC_18075 [Nonomuraea ferruginea]
MITMATIAMGSHATTAFRSAEIGFGPNTLNAICRVTRMIA